MTGKMAFEYILTQSDLNEEVDVFEVLHTAVSDEQMDKIRTAMQQDQSMWILIRTIRLRNNTNRRYRDRSVETEGRTLGHSWGQLLVLSRDWAKWGKLVVDVCSTWSTRV